MAHESPSIAITCTSACQCLTCTLFRTDFQNPKPNAWIDNLSATNKAPAGREETELRDMRKAFAEQALLLSRCMEKLAEYRELNDRLIKAEAKCKEALNPIRRLPTDVLVEIFGWDAVNAWKDELFHSLDITKGLHRLGQVCRSWRSLVLSTSSLWAQVTLNFDKYAPKREYSTNYYDTIYVQGAGVCFLLGAILTRSVTHPLSIDIRGNVMRTISGQPDDSSGNFLLVSLLQHAPRWRSLRWNGRAAGLAQLTAMASFFTSLSEMTVVAQEPATSFPLIFPNVRRLVVEGEALGNMESLVIPDRIVEYLATCTLRDSYELVATTLQKLPHLEFCNLELKLGQCSTESEATRQLCPRLRELVLSSPENDTELVRAGHLLNWIYAPHLMVLHTYIFSEQCIPEIVAFLTSSRCTLAHLQLSFPRKLHEDKYDLGILFDVTPALTILQVHTSNPEDLSRIPWQSAMKPPRLPSIRTISVDEPMPESLIEAYNSRVDATD